MPYKDKEKQKEYQRKWVRKRRDAWFSDKECVKCGSDSNLELDHVDPGKKVTHNVWSWAEDKRLKELAKCQALCSLCHKNKTNKYREDQVEHGTQTMRYKFGCECFECKEYVRRSKRESRARINKNFIRV